MSDPNDFWGKGKPANEGQGGEGDFWGSAGKGQPPKKDSGLRDDKPKQEAGFWGKETAQPDQPKAEGQEFWDKAESGRKREQAEREALLKDPDLKKRRRRRLVKRVLLGFTGVVVAAVVVGVVFLPQIASSMAPGIIQDKAKESITGTVSVGDVALSWGGPQRVEGVRLVGADGKEVARATVESTAGLWGLIRGNLDLGEVTITGGKADIVRDEDGTTNLQKALAAPGAAGAKPKKPAPKKSGDTKLPENLRVKLVVKSLDASILDRSAPGTPLTATLRDLDIKAFIAPGEPLNADVTLTAYEGLISGRPNAEGGSLTLNAKLDKWCRADGLLTIDKAKGKATITATGLPTSLVDALAPGLAKDAAGKPVLLADALGPAINLTVNAEGDGSDINADFDLAMANATSTGAVMYTGNDITGMKPITVKAKGSALGALAPRALAPGGGVTLDALPDATLTIQKLKYPMAKGGDLRGLAADATLQLAEISGKASLDPAKPKPLKIAPLTLRVQTDDLAKSVRVTGATKASLDGQPAGDLNLDVTASGVLDASGAIIVGLPGTIAGSAKITGIASAIAQPFVQDSGIDLARDVGPTIDLDITASGDASKGGGGAGGLPPTALKIAVTAEHAQVKAGLELSAAALRTSSDGVVINVARAGGIAARFVKPESGWALEAAPGAGKASITLSNLAVPRDAKSGEFKRDQAAGDVAAEIGGLIARQLGPRAGPEIRAEKVRADVSLKAGARARVEASATCRHASQPFDVAASFDVRDLYTVGADGALVFAAPMRLRPSGTLDAKGLPPVLAKMFMPAAKEGELDTAALVADTLAGPTDVKVAFKGVEGHAQAVDATVDVKSTQFVAMVGGVVDAERAAMRASTVTATVTPEILGTLLKTYAPSMSGSIGNLSLVGPARVQVAADAITIPLNADGSPAVDRTPTARARLTIAGQTFVDGLTVVDESGERRALGRLGVEDFTVRAEIPVAALVAPPLGNEKRAVVNAAGTVLGASGQAILALDAQGKAEISQGTWKGPLSGEVRLTKMNTGALERLAGREGLLTGLFGATADVDASVSIAPPEEGYGAQSPWVKGSIEAGLGFSSARMRCDKPLRVTVGKERIDLLEPATITLNPDPQAITTLLAGKVRATDEGKSTSVELVQADTVTVRLTGFSIPRAIRASQGPEVAGPARQATADVAMSLDAPSLTLRSGDGQTIALKGSLLTIATEALKPDKNGNVPPGGPPVTFKTEVAEARIGETPPAKGLLLTGRITDLFAPDGAIDLALGKLNMSGQVPAAPTAIVDSMLGQDGALLEALGPVISMKVNVERLPLMKPKPGSDGKYPRYDPAPLIDLEAKSSRASATLRGTVNEGLYVSERPLTVSVSEMTAEMVKRYVGIMPLIGVAEKTTADAPALLTASNLTVPLDGDWSRLNALIDLDPGQCRFQTSGGFATILKALHQKTTGSVGTRLDPLRVTITSGVANYNRWRVPVGEFTLETAGVVNLTKAPVKAMGPDGKEVELGPRSLDVVTWVPAGAVTDQALGLFNVGIGSIFAKLTPGLLEPLTMLPFRTRGTVEHPETKPDVSLVGDGIKNQLKKLDPRRLLEGLKPQAPTAPPTPSPAPSVPGPTTPTVPK
ncbi:hypothetical protein PHYC_00276 [Phycisphaerales bacterium]|nr:hypothetical protein PHYC_00276 [Phycisphaerales bacterium]